MKKAEFFAALRAVLISLAIISAVFYLLVARFYIGHFTANIFVNGILLTGQDIEGANRLLLRDTDRDYSFVITKDGKEIGRITDKDLDSGYDYSKALAGLKSSEAPFMWIPYLSGVRTYDIKPKVSYDKKKALKAVLKLPFVEEIPERPDPVLRISRDASGVYILENNTEDLKDREKLVNSILEAIEGGKIGIELNNVDYSFKYSETEEDRETKEVFDKIEKFQSSKVTLQDNGSSYVIEGSDIADLFVTDNDGKFVLDVKGDPLISGVRLGACVDEVSDLFNTKGKKIYWEKYSGGTVSLNSGQYGREVDSEKTAEIIKKGIASGENFRCSPVFTKETDKNGIGDTYVEVDMSKQHLYFIKNGRLFMHSDVVTGNVNRRNGTPETIEPIYFMQRNRVLVGDNYRTPVKFWMAFHNHVGLHDANWRNRFGGEIYKSNGSHGCVNLPPSFAEKLYAQAYVGLPVITYY